MIKLWFYPTPAMPDCDAIRCRSLDEAYRLIDGYGATDNDGNIVRPLFELVEEVDGLRVVLDCRRSYP